MTRTSHKGERAHITFNPAKAFTWHAHELWVCGEVRATAASRRELEWIVAACGLVL